MQSIVVVTFCFAMSAADPGLVGPTFLPGWNSVLSGIGDDDIESITRDAEKRPASVQTPLPSTACGSTAPPLEVVVKKPRLDDVHAQGMMDACRAASMAATAATEAVQMMQRFMESGMLQALAPRGDQQQATVNVVQHVVSQVGGGVGSAGSGSSISCTMPHDEISVFF